MRFTGLLYRALNPVFAADPLSGAGAQKYGGRFNPRGMPALYTALSPDTAIREANQAGTLQPTTLVAYRADVAPVFDTRDGALMARHGAVRLDGDDWRDRMGETGGAPTQRLARSLHDQGFAGLLVRSFAAGATARDMNLVLWHWPDLRLVDDEDRLGRAFTRE